MHFAISGTWGPTDPTRAMLPFIFAASAVQAGDTVTLMLFHDAVLMAVEGAGAKLVPVGPPNGLASATLDKRVKLGGMNEFHIAARQPDTRIIGF